MRSTHTIAHLDVSREAYQEIAAKLMRAGYDHAFLPDGVIDMHGIGLVEVAKQELSRQHRLARRLRIR